MMSVWPSSPKTTSRPWVLGEARRASLSALGSFRGSVMSGTLASFSTFALAELAVSSPPPSTLPLPISVKEALSVSDFRKPVLATGRWR